MIGADNRMINVDPRTKIIIVACISTMAVIIEDFFVLSIVFCLSLIGVYYFRGSLYSAIHKIRSLLYIVIGIVIMQSIFIKEGNVLIGTESLKIITDVGLIKGMEFLLRMIIVVISVVILSTSSSRQIIQGLTQWKIPYEIAFMVNVGIRFIPILLEEAKDTTTAINLRGIDVKKLRLKEKIELYSYILMPVVISTIMRAQKISTSIEARGFGAYNKRTSVLMLTMKKIDYLIIILSLLITISIFYTYYFI